MIFLVISFGLMLVGMFVQYRLRSKFREYSETSLQSNMSGKEVAEKMLRDNGIYDVSVVSVEGELTDHYNPMNKTVNLSPEVYNGRNAAAAAVAAHECGHAIQHATQYSMLTLRSNLVPVQIVSARIVSFLNMIFLFGGFMMYSNGNGAMLMTMLYLMVACNIVITLFALITLPVEFDASKRALAWIDSRGIVTAREHEMAKDALNWAAMTYVVAALGALANLMYYVSMLLGRRDD
ncbi:MAG: zinc metallopeptidase [Cytophagaceae bacterium]|nr:zinc metallopeptidase [Cytophagaceae bacterium]MDW8456175.1 zinc metallopeptidase [Cytophagaceae bacterium]